MRLIWRWLCRILADPWPYFLAFFALLAWLAAASPRPDDD